MVGDAVGGEGDRLAERLRDYGLAGWLAFLGIYAASILIPPVGTVLVLLWCWRSRTRWSEVGLARPKSWVRVIVAGIVLGLAFRAFSSLVLLPLMNAPHVNPAFKSIQGNIQAFLIQLVLMGFVNAFGEELVMRGFFFERLTGLFGRSAVALSLIALVTAAIFGIGHYPLQGTIGAVHAFIFGLLAAVLYVRSGSIWLPAVAHGASNIAGVTMIYLGVHH